LKYERLDKDEIIRKIPAQGKPTGKEEHSHAEKRMSGVFMGALFILQ